MELINYRFQLFNKLNGRFPLYGFDAISTHNGWAMAITGAMIVFSGLIILSGLISQLHKLAELLEKRTRVKATDTDTPVVETPLPVHASQFNIDAAIVPFRAASAALSEPFELSDLHQLARKMDLPHPHLTLSALRQKGELVDDGAGLYRWR